MAGKRRPIEVTPKLDSSVHPAHAHDSHFSTMRRKWPGAGGRQLVSERGGSCRHNTPKVRSATRASQQSPIPPARRRLSSGHRPAIVRILSFFLLLSAASSRPWLPNMMYSRRSHLLSAQQSLSSFFVDARHDTGTPTQRSISTSRRRAPAAGLRAREQQKRRQTHEEARRSGHAASGQKGNARKRKRSPVPLDFDRTLKCRRAPPWTYAPSGPVTSTAFILPVLSSVVRRNSRLSPSASERKPGA